MPASLFLRPITSQHTLLPPAAVHEHGQDANANPRRRRRAAANLNALQEDEAAAKVRNGVTGT